MANDPQPEPENPKAIELKPAPDSELALAGAKENPPAIKVKPDPGDPNAPHAARQLKPDPS